MALMARPGAVATPVQEQRVTRGTSVPRKPTSDGSMGLAAPMSSDQRVVVEVLR